MSQSHLLSVKIQWMTFREYWWLQTKQKKKNFNSVWWHDRKHYGDKKFQTIIKDLFIRFRKLNISLAFITQSYFSIPKDVRLNSTHYWLWKSTTEKNYKILQLIILHILIIKIMWGFTENTEENRIRFWKLIQHYQQVIL